MRWATAVILVSFALIIAATTVSTGHFAQVFGKLLYYVLVLSAGVSLFAWLYRSWVERRGE